MRCDDGGSEIAPGGGIQRIAQLFTLRDQRRVIVDRLDSLRGIEQDLVNDLIMQGECPCFLFRYLQSRDNLLI